MSVFNVHISIGDNERSRWWDLSATVDTASYMSSVPGSVLRELSVSPIMSQGFQLADGTTRNMDIGHTWLRVNGREVVTHIVFNDEYTSPLLGSLALETLLMAVDPVEERLIQKPLIPVYNLINPER